ncbi:hypothetical protein PC129_g15608 [Phytophthora cactorum]|uniref:Reverse transcriptase domain-containing protein n=1 Tax=Phytophthora cactorum TaxID=29920 RepID=A0A8T1HNE8_9STRA|nr:hypothetical protein PC114_g15758 [Phytophthora cactorum]KAG2943184.1 hypothetical protein PC117_g9538 [Phytophthora cactorum]KAG3021431.1 hypothetical protein PC119_g9640 [Phytophthora cactorum]KAG3144933.1 hypothetical protein C6341_g18581 [Phytophthora cactorum]KAG3193839.1 hypothetical protein PC128_g9919 [Phytophthora cactorum]
MAKWRIVDAFNKLNAATILAQTPIPRMNALQNNMIGSTLYSALDFVDGYCQLLMIYSDVLLTAMNTPSGMLWEWLVMSRGLSNAPATFNRLVIQLLRPHRAYAQTYFDDIFVHIRADHDKSDVENHMEHLRVVLEMRGLRAVPAKVKAIVEWPIPQSRKELCTWLGLANYLHKYSANYPEMAKPLSGLLKEDAP